ncbi:OsmC family protein [Fenollaria massiliensis]|uniref:OsmC family protein n=1 Tax=Fenollaria massiliensis TaxID=938288 RepID=UPI000365AA1C|nr:OsmC family protein [Fenollaria massiliensis]
MSSYGNFNSTEEMSRFDFTMRATSNDIKTVNSYGDMAFISTDQELPYDNEKKELSSVEIFLAGILESMMLTIIREAKIKKFSLDEIEAKAEVKTTNPLRTLKVVGVDEAPRIDEIKIKVYYYIDDITREEADKFMRDALEMDMVYSGVKKGFNISIDFEYEL